MTKHILFTGGGTAGHVTPNIALIKAAQQRGWRASYVGSYQGIERSLIEPLGISYYAINTGKLRRHFAWQTFLMPLQVIHGIWQSYELCKRLKPDAVFSKGGFVALPVVIGAWLNRIPVISHESDLSPGLANRMMYPFVKKIGVSMPHSIDYFKHQAKVIYTGSPIRPELLNGNAEQGKSWLHFSEDKPILLVIGGGLGSVVINKAVREALPVLLKQFNIVHCCGKGKLDGAFDNAAGYRQFEYINAELPNIMAATSLVVSRAGANSIYELLLLQKPHLLIPISKKISRGDQVENAAYFTKCGVSATLAEEDLTAIKLIAEIETLWQKRHDYQQKMAAIELPNATEKLLDML